MDYTDHINSMAAKYNIQPEILTRLVGAESNGDQSAVSPKGALGLTQLMPGTAKDMGVDPSDPLQNIEGGAKYLRHNLDKFGGDYPQALAGYNAGPNHKGVVTGNWDMLPTETKKYVNKFADLIIKPAQANETPYQEPTQKKDEVVWDTPESTTLDASQVVWDTPESTSNVKKAEPQTSNLEAFSHGAANFGTAGFTGEIVGGGIAALDTVLGRNKNLSLTEKYKLARDTVDEKSDVAWDERPEAYGGGAVIGGVLSPINKVLPGVGIMKQGAVIGGLYGAGNAKELSDIPVDALLSAGAGAIGGKVVSSVGTGVKNKLIGIRNNANQDITQEEFNNSITNLTKKVRGLDPFLPSHNPGNYPNQYAIDTIINAGNSQSAARYHHLERESHFLGFDIQTPFTTAKLKLVNDLDNTALDKLRNNALNRSALDKIENGMSLNPEEAANLHKHLTRISGVNGGTGDALREAKKALGEDIIAGGGPELTDALNGASSEYAKNKAMQSLNKIIKKHIIETPDGPVFNYKTLSTGLKNWSLSTVGRTTLRHNPDVKVSISNLQRSIFEHPEMKNLITLPKELNNFGKLFGNSVGSVITKNIGGVIGSIIGGPVGGVIGEGTQLGLRGVKSLGEKAIEIGMKTKFAQDAYRKSLKTKLGN